MEKVITLSNGSEASLPLVADDALVCFASFKADAGSLPKLPSQLAPFTFRGKTRCILLVADYRSISIGAYREIVVLAPVRYKDKSGTQSKMGVFIHEIAVTSEISMLMGREVWGFPKYLADISIEETTFGIKAKMESNTSAFKLSIPRWGLPLPSGPPLPVFSVKNNKLLFSLIKMKGVFFITLPSMTHIGIYNKNSTLSFLGHSARSSLAGFMKVSKAIMDAPVIVEEDGLF